MIDTIYILLSEFIHNCKIMQIEENIDLKPYNTLQIPVKAKYFVKIEKESDIVELVKTDLWKKENHCILN
jgi:UDP-N-acetylmuramate dehydrogenase